MAMSTLRTVKKDPEFNYKLLKIAKEITHDVLEDMKFVCDLPSGERESINEPREFLSILYKRGKIIPGDVTYLVSLLENTDNGRLASAVMEELGTLALPNTSHVNSLPCLTAHFKGREATVEGIIKKLTQVANPCRMIVIVSLPGMGKTQVAIRVSHDLLGYQKSVLFIEKQNSLTDVCSEILRRISRRHLSERHDLLSIAKRRLKELQEDTVIVLDSTEDIQGKEFDDLAEYLMKYVPKVQIIITSREDVGLASLNIHKERLQPLDYDSSLSLLQESVENCEEHGKELCELCGGIPLLLVHCACLLNDGFSPAVLIQELRENPIRLLKTSAKDVYDTLGQFLRRFPPDIVKNLVLVSFFPSAFSGKDIDFLFDDHLEQEVVKTKMVKCSLLQKMNNGMVVLHPLVREYCRAERKTLELEAVGRAAQHKFNHHYLELLKRLGKQFISKDSAMDAISLFRKDKANIMEALTNCLRDKTSTDERTFGIDVANSAEVLDFFAKVLSPPSECTKLFQWVCDITKAAGDKRRLADSLTSLGFRRLCDVAHRKGDQLTRDMLQQAYDIRMTLPVEHQKCQIHATNICKLGLCYELQGENEKGRKLIQEGIDLRKSLGVPLYVAAGYCDLGNAYRECGEHQTAIEIWEKETLQVYEAEIGDHPWTASILRYIAGSYKALADGTSELEKVDKATAYSKKALELRIKLLGVHQDTARSHVDLSEVLEIKKEFKLALEELEKALEIQKDVLGNEHESTMNTRAKMERISAIVQTQLNEDDQYL